MGRGYQEMTVGLIHEVKDASRELMSTMIASFSTFIHSLNPEVIDIAIYGVQVLLTVIIFRLVIYLFACKEEKYFNWVHNLRSPRRRHRVGDLEQAVSTRSSPTPSPSCEESPFRTWVPSILTKKRLSDDFDRHSVLSVPSLTMSGSSDSDSDVVDSPLGPKPESCIDVGLVLHDNRLAIDARV